MDELRSQGNARQSGILTAAISPFCYMVPSAGENRNEFCTSLASWTPLKLCICPRGGLACVKQPDPPGKWPLMDQRPLQGLFPEPPTLKICAVYHWQTRNPSSVYSIAFPRFGDLWYRPSNHICVILFHICCVLLEKSLPGTFLNGLTFQSRQLATELSSSKKSSIVGAQISILDALFLIFCHCWVLLLYSVNITSSHPTTVWDIFLAASFYYLVFSLGGQLFLYSS